MIISIYTLKAVDAAADGGDDDDVMMKGRPFTLYTSTSSSAFSSWLPSLSAAATSLLSKAL